jgi:pimeloyl-ACP methyl ester carboxylesterase
MGASYGTTLGATFATLFPDRVGRMILDGVDSGEDHFSGKYESFLLGADDVFKQFFRQCHAAESSECAFWGVSPSAIQNRFERLLQALRRNPVELPYTKLQLDEPILLTERRLREIVYAYARSGHTEFRNLAVTLAAVEGFEKLSSPIHEDFLKSKIWPWLVPPPCSRCSEQDRAVLRKDFDDMSAGIYFGTSSIRCTDADGRFIVSSVEQLKEHVSASSAKSRYVGDWAGVLPAVCRKWPFRPPPSQKFDGKYGAKSISGEMLILSTTYDICTPVRNARQLQEQFPGSHLLLQDAVSHCTLSVHSEGVSEAIRNFLASGSGPQSDLGCFPDRPPFA